MHMRQLRLGDKFRYKYWDKVNIYENDYWIVIGINPYKLRWSNDNQVITFVTPSIDPNYYIINDYILPELSIKEMHERQLL